MALRRHFEDLQAWREARVLTRLVYEISASGPLTRDFGLRDQIRRAALSCMNNVAEGFDSGSRVEFKRFLRYAMRSASEVQSCLYVALDQQFIDQASFERSYAQATAVRRLCGGLMRSLSSADAPAHRHTGTPRKPT